MNSPSDTLVRLQHSFVSALVVFWITLNEAYAQSSGTSFGITRSWSMPGEFERFLVSATDGRTHVVMLWNQANNRIARITIDSNMTASQIWFHTLQDPVTELLMEDLDGDQKPEIIALHAKEQRVSVYKHSTADTLKAISTIVLPFQPSKFMLAELTGDRKKDILVFNSDIPGIVPFLNRGNGRFAQAELVAQDNLVADLQPAQINNDGITDLIMLDWVHSELHLLFGIGQAKYIDMSTIPVEEGTTQCIATQLSSQGALDILLLSNKNQAVSVLEGDNRGGFTLRKKYPLPSPVMQLALSDFSQNGTRDILTLSKRSELQVWNDWQEDPTPESISYSAGEGTRQFALADLNFDQRKDVLLMDSERSSLVWYSGSTLSTPLSDSLEFVAGVAPSAVAIFDVNRDGKDDIALLNTESGSLSLYLRDSTNGFRSQRAYMLGATPRQLVPLSSTDSLSRFLVTAPQRKIIASLSVSTTEHFITRTDIPTPGQARVLSWDRQRNSMLSIFCFSPLASNSSGMLTLYQQIDAENFMERTFSLAAPGTLLGTTIADLNGDGRTDIAYISRNNIVKRFELAVSLGDSSSSYKQKTFYIDLPDKTFLHAMLWSSDFNRDQKPDMLFAQAGQHQAIRLALGRGDGTFNAPDTVVAQVSIEDRTQLQILDLDRDGFLDILVNDAKKKSLGWYRGITGRLFDLFRPLVSGENIGHFSAGFLNQDEFLDIAVTFPEKGTVKLFDGRMLLSRRNTIE